MHALVILRLKQCSKKILIIRKINVCIFLIYSIKQFLGLIRFQFYCLFSIIRIFSKENFYTYKKKVMLDILYKQATYYEQNKS